jgi:tetratricopeptide (TPR) repeat protein
MTRGSRILILTAGAIALSVVAAWWSWDRRKPDRLVPIREAYERKDWSSAAAYARKVLRDSPNERGALRLLARSNARLGRDPVAQELYTRLGEDAMQAEDYFLLGAGLWRQKQPDPALAVLERARKLDATHGETLAELARAYAMLDRLGDAVEVAERLAKVPGWEVRGGVVLGILSDKNADPERAVPALTGALQADPNLRGAAASPRAVRTLLARDLLEIRQPDKAKTQLDAVLSGGDDPEAFWLLSRALLQKNDPRKAAEALARAGEFGQEDPLRLEPSPYVGSASCAKCHKSIHRAQQNSRHARTLLYPDALETLALPTKPVADPDVPGLSHRLWHENGSIRLESKRGDAAIYRAVVAYALGSGDRGLTMIGRDDAGEARVFRISQYAGSIWDLTLHAKPPTDDDAGSILGRRLPPDAEAKCVDCHVTSFHAARDRGAPEARDRGIGCERCHGPGGNHLLAVESRFEDMAIAGAYFGSPEPITRMCGACHNTSDPTVLPGDAVTVRLQSLAMPQSRCYTQSDGGLSCLSCHEPHHDAVTSTRHYETQCLACHSPTAPRMSFLRSRTVLPEGKNPVPCPVNATSGCIQCHMPKSSAAAPHTTFTDHHIRIRREENAR